jgi:phytoene/squalene synthetase
MRFEVQRTREYFRLGLPLIDSVRGRLRVDLRLFTLGGLAVLDAIERQNYDVLSHRPMVSRAQKLWLGVRATAPIRLAVER